MSARSPKRLLDLKSLTLEGKRQVRELPNLSVVIVEDLVLPIVLNHVIFDERVVDDRWPHCLLVFLNLLLILELSLNVRLHRLARDR